MASGLGSESYSSLTEHDRIELLIEATSEGLSEFGKFVVALSVKRESNQNSNMVAIINENATRIYVKNR